MKTTHSSNEVQRVQRFPITVGRVNVDQSRWLSRHSCSCRATGKTCLCPPCAVLNRFFRVPSRVVCVFVTTAQSWSDTTREDSQTHPPARLSTSESYC